MFKCGRYNNCRKFKFELFINWNNIRGTARALKFQPFGAKTINPHVWCFHCFRFFLKKILRSSKKAESLHFRWLRILPVNDTKYLSLQNANIWGQSPGFIYHREILNSVMTRMISPNEGRNSICNLNCKQRFAHWTSVMLLLVLIFTSCFFLFRNVIRFEWYWELENTLSNLRKLIHSRNIVKQPGNHRLSTQVTALRLLNKSSGSLNKRNNKKQKVKDAIYISTIWKFYSNFSYLQLFP